MKSTLCLTEDGNQEPILENLTKSVKLTVGRDKMTEKILDLTLEIIYLLTGEDYTIVKNTGEGLAHGIHPHMSEKPHRTKSPRTEPSTHSTVLEETNDLGDLEPSKKIIQPLTGEVPVRCEDVAVYFSMEEWDYVEGHKELYRDVMMETRQPVRPLATDARRKNATSTSSADHRNGVHRERTKRGIICKKRKTKTRSPWRVRESSDPREKGNQNVTRTIEHAPTEKEEPVSLEERNLTDTDTYVPITEHAAASPTPIKEVSTSGIGGDLLASGGFPPAECTTTHIKEEPSSCVGGGLSDTGMHPPTDDPQTEYTSAYIMEEPTYQELPGMDIYTPSEHTEMHRISNPTKEETTIWEEVGLMHDDDIYTPEEHKTAQSSSTHVMNVPASWNGGDPRTSDPYIPNKQKDYVYTHTKATIYEQGNLSHSNIYFPSRYTPTGYPSAYINQGLSAIEDHFDVPSEHAFDDDIFYYDGPYGEKPVASFGMMTCDDCGEIFNNKMALTRHRRTHGADGMYNCPQCQKCFSNSSDLLRHRALYDGKNLTCSQCGMHFISKSNLVRHYRVHTGRRPFACLECEKSFRSAWNLAQHRATHTGEKPFACSVCGKGFARSAHLVTHQRSHTGEKPYVCPTCGKYFAQKSNLVTHQRTHTREKPFQCSECGQSFTVKESLFSHQTIHSKDKSLVVL